MPVEINQIPITTTSITSGSFFPLDLATGGSPAYETRKATLNTLANEVLDEQLTGDRFLNINGNVLNLYGGQVSIGTPSGSNYALEVNDTTFNGGGSFLGSIIGVRGFSTSGTGVAGQSSSGLGGKFEGGAYVETYGFGGSAQSSAVFEAASTTKGALIPRMTTTQRDAISSPATGLEIFNTTTNRKEFYNGTYWAGQRNVINIFHGGGWNPVDGQALAFGAMPIVPQSAVSVLPAFNIVLRGNGVIRACTFNSFAGSTAGSGEGWSLYIRHNSTDYLVATVSSTSAIRVFENTALNIPYVDGDTMKMILVNPTWATNPASVQGQGTVTLE